MTPFAAVPLLCLTLGAAAARAAGEQRCQGRARAAQGGALRYDYGWEWPTRTQWESGQRHGYCWAPA